MSFALIAIIAALGIVTGTGGMLIRVGDGSEKSTRYGRSRTNRADRRY